MIGTKNKRGFGLEQSNRSIVCAEGWIGGIGWERANRQPSPFVFVIPTSLEFCCQLHASRGAMHCCNRPTDLVEKDESFSFSGGNLSPYPALCMYRFPLLSPSALCCKAKLNEMGFYLIQRVFASPFPKRRRRKDSCTAGSSFC